MGALLFAFCLLELQWGKSVDTAEELYKVGSVIIAYLYTYFLYREVGSFQELSRFVQTARDNVLVYTNAEGLCIKVLKT